MKKLLLPICGLLIVTFASCLKKDTDATLNVSGSEATIPWQDCAVFTSHNLTVCFVDANESRCPCNTNCIWEGMLEATLRVTSPAGLDTTVVLAVNSDPGSLPNNSVVVAGKRIRLVGTNISDCNDYGNYEKYKVTIAIGSLER